MRNTRYGFSSVHVEPPQQLADEIVAWGRQYVLDDEIFVHKLEFGREDEIHATALYGLHTNNSRSVETLLQNQKIVEVTLGKLKVFPSLKFDVLVIDVISHDLKVLNQLLRNLDHTNHHSSYQPHMTIAYMKHGKAWRFLGLPIWEQCSFSCDYVVFSAKDAVKNHIPIGQGVAKCSRSTTQV